MNHPLPTAPVQSAAIQPLVGVSACLKLPDGRPAHTVGDKYLTPLVEVAGATPVILPALGEQLDRRALLRRLDGLVLTGSPSNVHPGRYGAAASAEAEPYDEARDATVLPLIREAVAAGVPLLAICRGFQEMNVAFGGTLTPALHQEPGRADHRRPDSADPDVQYGPRHSVTFAAGGLLARIAGQRTIQVNSLHRQGILALAPALEAEGRAPDGTVEAVAVRGAAAFAVGVQWHPEYRAADNDFSRRLYGAFGDAIRARAAMAG